MINRIDIKFNIDTELIETFKHICNLKHDDEVEVIEIALRKYITESLEGMLHSFKNKTLQDSNENELGLKVIKKIELWKEKPWQNNHKLLKAFWSLEDELGYVTINMLQEKCSNKEEFPSTYIEKFKGNFDQMLTEKGNSNGKVFDIYEGNKVRIWEKVIENLQSYKKYFIDK